MNSYKVYMHVFPNSKCYVGKCVGSVSNRKGKNWTGYKSCQKAIWHAIQKCKREGTLDQIRTIILKDNLSEPCAFTWERLMILKYKSHRSQNGYNMTWGGDGWDSDAASRIAREANRKQVADGTHNFLGKSNPSHKRIANGTHNFQNPEFYQKRYEKFLKDQRETIIIIAEVLYHHRLSWWYSNKDWFNKPLHDFENYEQQLLF